MNDRLYRSRDDRVILGVAGGLSVEYGVDAWLLRILWLILIIPTGGVALLLYVILAFVVPEEPLGETRRAPWQGGAAGTDRFAWPDTGARVTAMTSANDPTTTSSPGGGVVGPPVSPTPSADDAARRPIDVPASLFSSAAAPLAPTVNPSASPADPRMSARVARADARDQRRAARDERRAWRREHHDGRPALIGGLILILVGSYFLLRAYLPSFDADRAWPVLLVIIGAALLVGSLRRSGGSDSSAGPGGAGSAGGSPR